MARGGGQDGPRIRGPRRNTPRCFRKYLCCKFRELFSGEVPGILVTWLGSKEEPQKMGYHLQKRRASQKTVRGIRLMMVDGLNPAYHSIGCLKPCKISWKMGLAINWCYDKLPHFSEMNLCQCQDPLTCSHIFEASIPPYLMMHLMLSNEWDM